MSELNIARKVEMYNFITTNKMLSFTETTFTQYAQASTIISR